MGKVNKNFSKEHKNTVLVQNTTFSGSSQILLSLTTSPVVPKRHFDATEDAELASVL